MGLEPNGDWKRMQSAMLVADVTGDWMEGVVVAQLVMENSTARPKCVKGEQAADGQVTTLSSACLSNPKRADCIKEANGTTLIKSI